MGDLDYGQIPEFDALIFLHRGVTMIGWRWKNVCQSALLQGLQGRLLSLLEDYMYSTGDTRATSLITHVHGFNRDQQQQGNQIAQLKSSHMRVESSWSKNSI